MEFWSWVAQHWFDLLNSAGIIGGLIFTCHALRTETKTRRISNLILLTQNQRELWSDFYDRQQLARVLDNLADLDHQPVTQAEETFVNMVIQHLHAVYQATRNGLVVKPEGVRREVWSFFSLPIPKAVWELVKVLQNDDFAAFVEACRNWK